jgi:predicted O-methyltransferase YrrM
MDSYEFTTPWFEKNRMIWAALFEQIKPSRVLEIGSFEGAASCFMIDHLKHRDPSELICIDSWEQQLTPTVRIVDTINMSDVEKRFDRNSAIAVANNPHVSLTKIKARSHTALPNLLAEGKRDYFDFIYIDGSHEAPDVMFDAVLGFEMVRLGGVMVFDDYLLTVKSEFGPDPLRSPKLAIDAFTTIFSRRVRLMEAPNFQVYAQKVSRH